jgi:hypothetical protein
MVARIFGIRKLVGRFLAKPLVWAPLPQPETNETQKKTLYGSYFDACACDCGAVAFPRKIT